MPIRAGNLTGLRIDQHIHFVGDIAFLSIPADKTKTLNLIDAELGPRLTRWLRLYIERYRPLLIQAAVPWLFPGQHGARRSTGGFSDQISAFLAQHVGVTMTLHQFRHLDVLEASVLSGLKTHLMHPDLLCEFIAEYHRELNRLNSEREQSRAHQKEELARIERQIHAIIEAVKDGMRTQGMKEELIALEARKADLVTMLKSAPPSAARLHPGLAGLYHQKIQNLVAELNRPELRDEASEALRALISEILLIPENDRLEIEVSGDLARILALSSGGKKPVSQGDGLQQVTLVAGVRNHLYRTILVACRQCPLGR